MSLDISFDTIVLLIATIIQSDRIHISAKSLKSQQSDFSIHEYRIKKNMFSFPFFFLFLLIPFS